MPAKEQHTVEAQRNRDFACSLDRHRYPEWVVVGWFYCALHLADALLAETLPGKMGHPRNHEARWTAMSVSDAWKRHPALRKHYRALESLSRQARYDFRPGALEFTSRNLERVYRDHFLPLVETLEGILS